MYTCVMSKLMNLCLLNVVFSMTKPLNSQRGISCKVYILLQYLELWPVHWCFDNRAPLILPSCKSDSWIRYTLKCLCWCPEGEVGELVQPGERKWGLPWGLLCRTSGRRKLYMVPWHSCHNFGIWRNKVVEEGRFKVIIWGGNASHKGGNFYGEGGSYIVILLY